MSVYHCPLCPLIFQYRSEAEWHLREEHRSRADEAADLRTELAAAARPLDWERLTQLRSSTAGPSVTLLLSTAPAATMTVLDIARLRQLSERARRRLSAEHHRETVAGVVEERLSKVVSAAESHPTDRGLAVLVNQHHLGIFSLPFGPRDRHVVGHFFATRDLDYALRRYPRYRVLVLGHHPRILEGHARQLSEPATPARAGSPRSVPPVDAVTDSDPDTLLSERIASAGALPLVVVGPHQQLDRFRRQSRYAGEVVTDVAYPRFRKGNAADLVADVLDRLHHDRQSRSVAELLHADLQAQVAWGVQASWNAINNGAADRLWVEHDYSVSGRTSPGVYGIDTATDPGQPGAIDDLVEALLARAAQLGIRTDLLDRHTLGRPEPVAVRIPVPVSARSHSSRALAEA